MSSSTKGAAVLAARTIRYWAAAKEAAGVAEEHVEADTLGQALTLAKKRHAGAPEFETVLARCSLLVDGTPVGSRDHDAVVLPDSATIEVLPPFAGGAR